MKRLFVAAALIAFAAFSALKLTRFSDNIGFSSNHEFYFRVRHPVRAMLLAVTMWSGIAISAIAGLGWAWFACRHRNEGA